MRRGAGSSVGGPVSASVILVLSAACAVRPESVRVEPSSVVLAAAGATMQLKATPLDGAGLPATARPVRFLSANPRVASVSSSGLVTAVRSGRTYVTAISAGASGTAQVTVAIPAGIVVVPAALTLVGVGSRTEISALQRDEDGQPVPGARVAWEDETPGIVAIDGGKLTAVGVGTTSVWATAGGLRARAIIRVEQPPFESVRAPQRIHVRIGERALLQPLAVDAAGAVVSGAVFSYASGDPTIAVVDATGQVTGAAKGRTHVSVVAGTKHTDVEIDVRK